MSRRFRLRVIGAALAAGVAVLGAGGATAGFAAAHVTAKPPPPVDHQLCYAATATGFKIPKGVTLKNQFGSFMPKITSAVVHCNPVEKILPSGVTKITNPQAHLACFKITAPPQPQHLVLVSNQFGEADLNTFQPNLLCLPSWKKLTGPPNMKQPQPPGLSHFTCYRVTVNQGAYHIPAGIRLRDEFTSTAVRVHVNPVPVELCLPTQKTVGGKVFKIVNPTLHLLCYPVSKTPRKPHVYDQNQFGTAKVTITATNWLCVPSKKTLIR